MLDAVPESTWVVRSVELNAMNSSSKDDSSLLDPWFHWLLKRRHGGDPIYEKIVRHAVKAIRDRVLDQAIPSADQVLVDVGAGDGLIAFGAFERVGPSLTAIFADISLPLLEEAERVAVERGLREQCVFLNTRAEDLEGIQDEAAHVVTCRAVLAYVPIRPKRYDNSIVSLNRGAESRSPSRSTRTARLS